VEEHGVAFVGSSCREDQERLVAEGKLGRPDAIFLEGAFDAAPHFRAWFPGARIVHVGQNVDRLADRAAFELEQYIDLYALVGPGQLADYCVRFPHLRHKFHLLRNVVPWPWLCETLPRRTVVDSIAWVGSWGKQGLRLWAEVMERVLNEWPTYSWTLYGPSYGSSSDGFPDHLFYGLDLPEERVFVLSVPMSHLCEELSSARVVLVSLGGECGPVSVLDAHMAGRPVLSGNDMVYKFSNPSSTGIRVGTVAEAYQALVHLLRNPQICDQLGAKGQKFVLSAFTEKHQRKDLERILDLLTITSSAGSLVFKARSRRREALSVFEERLRRKLRKFWARDVGVGLANEHSQVQGDR
jgi:glycosyltransferase involved in cell wall biosynthesis